MTEPADGERTANAPIVGDLVPAFRAMRDGDISMGRLIEIVHGWLDGKPYLLPDERPEFNDRWLNKTELNP